MNRVTRYSFRCEFYPLTGSNDYLKKFCKVYYDNLNYRISNKTYLKMHPADDDIIWKNYDFYKKISNSKVDKKEGLKKVFENSKLITCLYPETTFAECITNDTPTILLYPKNLYERHDKFLYVINKMKESNIIFFDPVKAALHINNIWNDVDTWWKENKTKACVPKQQLPLPLQNYLNNTPLKYDGIWKKNINGEFYTWINDFKIN